MPGCAARGKETMNKVIMNQEILRQIPKMDILLEGKAVSAASKGLPRAMVRSALQAELELLRKELLAGGCLPEADALDQRMAAAVRRASLYRMRRLINASGIVLHTNLGRAPLGKETAEHVAYTAAGYSNLEYDLKKGKRGSRYDLIEEELCKITGAEAALLVNNNAAAVFLMLNTLAKGKKTIISRGELVEIGGSFRIPDIMSASGALLHEIGTTNKTHLQDYEKALSGEEESVLLKVHSSNFKILGFSEEVDIRDLKKLAESHEVPLLFDLGAGFLIRPEEIGIPEEIYVPNIVKYADICCFSGDKLFGAGQAGILLGKKSMIDAMKKNQLTRMLRVDKMTLAALEASLRWYQDPEAAKEHIPVLKMLSMTEESLREKAENIAALLRKEVDSFAFRVIPCEDEPGGGSLPALSLPGWAIQIETPALSPNQLEKKLREAKIPVIGRIWKNQMILSVRTILEEDIDALVKTLSQVSLA